MLKFKGSKDFETIAFWSTLLFVWLGVGVQLWVAFHG